MPRMPPTHKPPRPTTGIQHRLRTADDQFYSRRDWRRVRWYYLHQHPLCADPLGRHAEDHVTVPACDVHHKLRRRDNPDSAFRLDDLEALCHACHSVVTAGEKLGLRAGSGVEPGTGSV